MNNMNSIVNIINIKNEIYKEISIKFINKIKYNNRKHIINSIFTKCDSFIPELANNNTIINDESILKDYIQLVQMFNNNKNVNIKNQLIQQYNEDYQLKHIAFPVQTRSMTKKIKQNQTKKRRNIIIESD